MGSESALTEGAGLGEDVPLEAGADLDGRYRVVDVLGSGGVGIVYRAEHLGLKREVAVKVLRKSFVRHVSLRPRFEREARAMAAMSHPNIVAVMDYGVMEGSPYIVMELLEGRTLRELMDDGPVEESEALRIARTLLRGLGYAHARGLVHRDVKPGNVMLQSLDAQGEHVKLLDFGFAKIQAGSDLTTGSMISAIDETFGTPAYMAPEQAMGDQLDHRADLYSVGILIFEMLAGGKPFDGELHEIVKAHLAAPVPAIEEFRPDIRARPMLIDLLRKALAKNPRDRFANADEMIAAIEALPRGSLVPRPIWDEEAAQSTTRGSEKAPEARKNQTSDGVAHLDQLPKPLPRKKRMPPWGYIAAAVAIVLGGFVAMLTSEETSTAENVDPSAVAATEAERAAETERAAEAVREAEAVRAAETGAARLAEAVLGSEAGLQAESQAEAVVGSETGPEVESETEVMEVLPWEVHPRVPLLESIREDLDAGRTPARRAVQQLRAYSRGNRADPRPHLLLARIFHAKHWWTDALARLTLAYEVDPRISDDPLVREMLFDLAANPHVQRQAAAVVAQIYGTEGVGGVEE